MIILKVLLYNKLSMKRELRLTEEEIIELEKYMKEEKRVKIYRRLLFVKLKNEKKKNTEIMKIIPVSINTLSDWTTKYLKDWLKWLWILKYEWRRIGKLEENKEKIKDYVKTNIVSTLSELKNWLKQELNIDIENSWLWEFCKKNWIFLIKKQKNYLENIKQ